jgi:hypothetical protein
MMTPDGREIVFAGAGILWGATTLFRGFRLWRTEHKLSAKSPVPSSLIAGAVLVLGCTTYLTWSLIETSR